MRSTCGAAGRSCASRVVARESRGSRLRYARPRQAGTHRPARLLPPDATSAPLPPELVSDQALSRREPGGKDMVRRGRLHLAVPRLASVHARQGSADRSVGSRRVVGAEPEHPAEDLESATERQCGRRLHVRPREGLRRAHADHSVPQRFSAAHPYSQPGRARARWRDDRLRADR